MGHYIQSISVRWYNACAYYAVALSRGLKELGHRVTFAGAGGTPALEKAAEIGIEVLTVPSGGIVSAVQPFRLIETYRKYALNHSVTLVNVHHGSDHILWSLALRGTGIPLVRTSGNQLSPRMHPLSRFLVDRKTAGVIASCRTIQNYYSEGFGLPRDSVPVINGGVDTGFYAPCHPRGKLRNEAGVPGDAFVFGITARFSPGKGHEIFFRAAGEVAKHHPEAWFFVAGWSAQFTADDIRAMAQRADVLARTVFIGRHPDSRDIIGSLDAGVVPSFRSETVCRIAMEYMAMGVPVIGSDTNVIPEVVNHHETGLIVPAGNSVALAQAMEHLLESREAAKEMGERARKRVVCRNSLESFARETLEAYGSFIEYG